MQGDLKLLGPHQSHMSIVEKMCVRLEKVDATCLWNCRLWGYLYLILTSGGPRAAKNAHEKAKREKKEKAKRAHEKSRVLFGLGEKN